MTILRVLLVIILALAATARASSELVIERKSGRAYRFAMDPPPPEVTYGAQGEELLLSPSPSEILASFTAEERRVFFERRELLLRAAARALDPLAPAVGTTTSLTEAWTRWRKRRSDAQELDLAAAAAGGEGWVEPESQPRDAYRRRGHVILRELMAGLDVTLWRDADLLVRQNEYGLTILLSLDSGAQTLTEGYFRAYSAGISLVFNKDRESVRTEVFTGRETMPFAFPYYFQLISAGIKVLPFIGYTGDQRQGTVRDGALTLTPGPFAVARLQNRLEAGLSLGIGFPPAANPLSTMFNRTRRWILFSGEAALPRHFRRRK